MSTQASGETDTADIRMRYDPARAKALVDAFTTVSERVAKVAGGRNVGLLSFFSLITPPSPPLQLPEPAKYLKGQNSSSIQTQARIRHPRAAPRGQGRSFRRELCAGADGEGGAAAEEREVAFHWGVAE